MATKSLCSIEGCGKPAKARGYCAAHHERWRNHGDPLGGRVPNGEALRFFREVLTYDGDDCQRWPYITDQNGYGKVHIGDRLLLVSRQICEEVHGPAPSPRHEAAHSCGHGNQGCCTKQHLSWKTHAGNMADMVDHGTSPRGERNGQAELTADEVLEIRALSGVHSHRVIGKMFDISRQHVGGIINKRSWAWLE